jgi:hypothetical protein
MEPFANETVTVSVAAVALSPAVYAPAGRAAAQRAVLTVEGSDIRWWAAGSAPTPAVGHLAQDGDVLTLDGPNTLRQFQAIRAGGADGALQVTYER